LLAKKPSQVPGFQNFGHIGQDRLSRVKRLTMAVPCPVNLNPQRPFFLTFCPTHRKLTRLGLTILFPYNQAPISPTGPSSSGYEVDFVLFPIFRDLFFHFSPPSGSGSDSPHLFREIIPEFTLVQFLSPPYSSQTNSAAGSLFGFHVLSHW